MNTRRSFIKKSAGTALVFGLGVQTSLYAWSVSGCVKDGACIDNGGVHSCACHGGKDCATAICSLGHSGHEDFCRRVNACDPGQSDGFCNFYDEKGVKCCEATCWSGPEGGG